VSPSLIMEIASSIEITLLNEILPFQNHGRSSIFAYKIFAEIALKLPNLHDTGISPVCLLRNFYTI